MGAATTFTDDDGRRADVPPVGLVGVAVRWPLKVAEEVLLAPWTIAAVREGIVDLVGRIERLEQRLDDNTGDLGPSIRQMATEVTDLSGLLNDLLPTVAGVIVDLEARVGGAEVALSSIGQRAATALQAVPGVRRMKSVSGPGRTDTDATERR